MYLVLYSALIFLVFKEDLLQETIQNKLNGRLGDKKINLFKIMTIILTFVAGFRYYVGTDYGTYVDIFYGMFNFNDYSYLEVGFRALIMFIKVFTYSPVVLFLTVALISMTFFYYGVKKLSKKPMLSLYIFFCVFYIGYIFNGIRQGITMCIFLYAISYFEEKDYKKVILLAIIASCFHSSGIYIVFAYIVYILKLELILQKKHYIYILIGGIILCLFNPLQSILINIDLFGIGEKVRVYTENGSSGLGIISIMQRIMLLYVLILNFDYMDTKNKKIFNVYMLGWIAYSVFSFQNIIATRINLFFRVLEIILLPNIIQKIDDKNKKKYLYIFIIAWVTLILLVDLRNPANFPYRFIGGGY